MVECKFIRLGTIILVQRFQEWINFNKRWHVPYFSLHIVCKYIFKYICTYGYIGKAQSTLIYLTSFHAVNQKIRNKNGRAYISIFSHKINQTNPEKWKKLKCCKTFWICQLISKANMVQLYLIGSDWLRWLAGKFTKALMNWILKLF